MSTTCQELLDVLIASRDAEYESKLIGTASRLACLENIVQAMLEREIELARVKYDHWLKTERQT